MLCRSVSIDAWYTGAASIAPGRKRSRFLSKAWHDEPQKIFFRKEENMKKIFAFILATIMVMSLVPASVFAAFTKCPATHTKDNSACTVVKVVAPTCQSTGYTLYSCNACGEQFPDDVKKASSHKWVSDPKKAHLDIAASCLYETNGSIHQICSYCNKTQVKTVDYKSTDVHKLVKVSGVGCEELYECSICGDRGYIKDKKLNPTAAHTIEFKKIITEPYWADGVAHNGLALYACKTSGCAYEKEVIVVCPDCAHPSFTKIVTEKAANCTADGTYGVHKCDDCGALYYDSNLKTDKTELVALTDVNGDKAITTDDAIIKAPGHTLPAANQITLIGCTRTYTCTTCKEAVVEEFHANIINTTTVDPTCVTFGITYKACTLCGTQWPELTDPLGHTDDEVIIPSNCAVQGGRYTVCTRPGCPLVEVTLNNDPSGNKYKVVGVELFPLDKNAHDLYNIGTDGFASSASCTSSGLVITACHNGCVDYLSPKVEYKPATNHNFVTYRTTHNCSTATATLFSWTGRTYLKCTSCGLNTYDDYKALGYTSAYYVDTRDSSIKFEFASLAEAQEYHGVAVNYWTYNSSKKTVSISKTEARPEAKHELKFISTFASTCKAQGYDLYQCTGCGQQVKIMKATVKHTNGTFVKGTAATCNTAGVRESWLCGVCGVNFYYDYEGNQKTGSLVINPCGNYDTLVLVKNCKGTKYYQCSICKTYYSGFDCKTAVAPIDATNHNWQNAYKGTAATCNTTGVLEVRYCKDCALLEVNALYEYAGEIERLSFGSWAGAYKKSAKAVSIDNLLVVSKPVTVSIAKSGAVSFICDTVTTSTCPVVVNKFEHTKPTLAKAVEWESAVTSERVEDTSKDHTKPMFTKNYCEACSYEFITNYVGAYAGHINDKGNVITTKCDNEGVKGGRVCQLCLKAGKTEAEATITVAHTWSTETKSTMTCVSDGYTYKYCLECGHYSISGATPANADSYHKEIKKDTKKMELVGSIADYAHDGSYYYACPECGKQLTDTTKGKVKGTGLEIYLSTDAELYIPGSTVKVTVTLDSANGVNVWAIGFPVIFDSDVFEFVGYEFNTAESAFQTFAVTEVAGGYNTFDVMFHSGKVTDGQFKDSGVLHIVANADADTLVKGEQTLVTLEFKVVSPVAAEDVTFAVAATEVATGGVLGKKLTEIYPDYATDPMFVAQYGNLYDVVVDSTVKTIAIEAINASGKPVAAVYNKINESAPVDIAAFLDLDGKPGITLADAYELYYLIYNNEYDVKADANFDGKVNGQDLSILYAVYTGVITVEQLIAPDAELPEGWYAGLGVK